MYLLYNEPVT